MMGFWDAVASAGPNANNQTDNHTNTSSLNFLQDICSFSCPTNSVRALKAIALKKSTKKSTEYTRYMI